MDDSASDIEWLSRSAVAHTRSPEIILNLHEYFNMDGVSCYSPRIMGGNADLHTFHSVNLMHDRLVRCVIGSSNGLMLFNRGSLILLQQKDFSGLEWNELHAWISELSSTVDG